MKCLKILDKDGKSTFHCNSRFKVKGPIQREQLGFSENAFSVPLKSKISLFNLDRLSGL